MMHLYSALLLYCCVMWGGGISPQQPPVCSIHLDDATAATGQRHQCARHTPAKVERRERHRANQVDARHRANQVDCSHHTPATGGEERVIDPIKCMLSPHTSYRWRGESHSAKCMLSPQPATGGEERET